MFSFNSAAGACDTCRGFGRVIGVDYGLVIPDEKTLRSGAIKAIQTPAWKECQDDLMRHAETAGIPRDTWWHWLTPSRSTGDRGLAHWNGKWNQQWYGIRRFFEYLETKPTRCTSRAAVKVPQLHAVPGVCGARLRPSLLWRIGRKLGTPMPCSTAKRFMPRACSGRAQLATARPACTT